MPGRRQCGVAQYRTCVCPLSTLHAQPCNCPRMTRGHRGLLLLRCETLSSLFLAGLSRRTKQPAKAPRYRAPPRLFRRPKVERTCVHFRPPRLHDSAIRYQACASPPRHETTWLLACLAASRRRGLAFAQASPFPHLRHETSEAAMAASTCEIFLNRGRLPPSASFLT